MIGVASEGLLEQKAEVDGAARRLLAAADEHPPPLRRHVGLAAVLGIALWNFGPSWPRLSRMRGAFFGAARLVAPSIIAVGHDTAPVYPLLQLFCWWSPLHNPVAPSGHTSLAV